MTGNSRTTEVQQKTRRSNLRVHRTFSQILPSATEKRLRIPPDTVRKTDTIRNTKPEKGDQRNIEKSSRIQPTYASA